MALLDIHGSWNITIYNIKIYFKKLLKQHYYNNSRNKINKCKNYYKCIILIFYKIIKKKHLQMHSVSTIPLNLPFWVGTLGVRPWQVVTDHSRWSPWLSLVSRRWSHVVPHGGHVEPIHLKSIISPTFLFTLTHLKL